MTPPTPEQITSLRAITLWVLRAAAITLLALGAYLLLKKMLLGMLCGAGFMEMTFQVWEGVGEQHSTYRGLAMLAVGSALALTGRRLARWIVAMPEPGCPRCGYAGAVTETCPECGQAGVAPRE